MRLRNSGAGKQQRVRCAWKRGGEVPFPAFPEGLVGIGRKRESRAQERGSPPRNALLLDQLDADGICVLDRPGPDRPGPDRPGRDEAHEPAGDAGVAAIAGDGDQMLRWQERAAPPDAALVCAGPSALSPTDPEEFASESLLDESVLERSREHVLLVGEIEVVVARQSQVPHDELERGGRIATAARAT